MRVDPNAPVLLPWPFTLREWYAGQALSILPAYLKTWGTDNLEPQLLAGWAFQIADAMLAESKKERRP